MSNATSEPAPEPAQEQNQEQTQEQEPEQAHEALTAADELSAIAEKSGAGENSILGLGLAVLAVAGGGAAWKFYQKFSEQKHEQAMKKLEIDATNAGMNGVQPPPCQAANVKIEAEIATLKAELAECNAKIAANSESGSGSGSGSGSITSSISAMSDTVEELEGRIKRLEKLVKKK